MNVLEKLDSLVLSSNKIAIEETARKANQRGRFLSHLNRAISGPLGDKLVGAYASGDVRTFVAAWKSVTREIAAEVKKSGKTVTATTEAVVAALETASDTEGTRVVWSKQGAVAQAAGGAYVAVVCPTESGGWAIEEEQVLGDGEDVQAAADELMIKYDLRPDQVVGLD